MIGRLEIHAIDCVQKPACVNLSLMNDIFFLTPPVVGASVVIEEWNVNTDPMDKETLATAVVTKVSQQVVDEWNPVLKERTPVGYTYVTLLFNGKAYVRRCLQGGLSGDPPAKGFAQSSLASESHELPD